MTFEQQLKSGQLGRIEDKKYLKFVRSLPCCVCDNPDSVPHHLIGYGYGGMGTKAPDYLAMPLCLRHHTGDCGIHGKSPLKADKTRQGTLFYRMEWERNYGSQWEHIALTQMQWLIEHKK